MKETLRELEALAELRRKELAGREKGSRPVIGWSGPYIPEELIRAAGADTWPLGRGGGSVPVNPVLRGQLRFMNPLARNLAGYPQSDPGAPACDLLVIQQTDCHTARAGELLAFEGKPVCLTGIPSDWTSPASFSLYEEALRGMLARVEEITGRSVNPDAAGDNFAGTNRINALFRRLNLFRKTEDPPFGFSDWIRLQHVSLLVEDSVLTGRLEELCRRLEDRASGWTQSQNGSETQARCNEEPGQREKNGRPSAGRRPRILLAGRAVAPGDYMLTQILEESGAVIAAQMLDEGIRIYEKDIDTEGDLIRNFAGNRYLDTVPANFMLGSWERRFDHMMSLIEDRSIDGVVWYQLSFDELYDMEYAGLAERLSPRGIPLIKLESSYDDSPVSMGMITTRAESFVESLRMP